MDAIVTTRPTGSAHLSLACGGLVLAGGIYAFVKTKSKPSLIGSIVLGGALLSGGFLISRGESFAGHSVSAAASVGLITVGASRYAATKTSMPAFPLLVIGLLSSVYQIRKAFLLRDT